MSAGRGREARYHDKCGWGSKWSDLGEQNFSNSKLPELWLPRDGRFGGLNGSGFG